MENGLNLDKIYELRKSFTIIGLTGRTGSGCSYVANMLEEGFQESKYPLPSKMPEHNTDRKYKIVHNYAKQNFTGYEIIEYKYIIPLFVFSLEYERLEWFIDSNIGNTFNKTKFKAQHNLLYTKLSKFDFDNPDSIKNESISELYRIYKSNEYRNACDVFNQLLIEISYRKRIEVFHIMANNIRHSGCAICEVDQNLSSVYNIVTVIKKIIKGIKSQNENCKVVIDSLRNPLEIMYLRERFSAFYMITVNSDESKRIRNLTNQYKIESIVQDIIEFDQIEYENKNAKAFYKQNVSECIQKSDIHLSNIDEEETIEFNKKNLTKNIITSPKFSLKKQLLKYVSLIDQPGIVTPSPEERCMQIAFTAKYNSGCISRQVGAVITDNNYSIKAVGWNNTPEGHTPCLLRSADDLVSQQDDKAFSDYEKNDLKYHMKFKELYTEEVINNKNLKGRNVSYCFKCIQNSIKEGKNQVHTRSLHAEESAFLQISKYGGQGVKGGKLFTTASPCELCAKKAYQLGIEVIYYVDLYPGISISHILDTGLYPKEIRLFHGAIGGAYSKLYAPFMAYKDELSIITNLEIKDLISTKDDKIRLLKEALRQKDPNNILLK